MDVYRIKKENRQKSNNILTLIDLYKLDMIGIIFYSTYTYTIYVDLT